MIRKLFQLTLAALFFILPALGEVPASAPDSFHIGVILPLTGPLTEFGSAFSNGAQLAREQEPQLFSSCRMTFEDSRYDGKAAVAAFQKLTEFERVNLIYNWGTVTSEPIAPLAEQKRIPLIAWSADKSVSQHRRFVIRFANSAADYGRALAMHLSALGYRRSGLVVAQTQYLEAMLTGLRSSLPQGQIIEVVESVMPTETDFRSLLPRLRGKKFDALGVYLVSGQVAQFYRELKQQSYQLPTFGTDFFESASEIEAANGAMEGAFYANNTVSQAFQERYQRRFGNALQITHAGNGFDFARLACRYLAPLGRAASSTQILQRLQTIKAEDGVQGRFSFNVSADEDQNFSFPVVIKAVIHGVPQAVEEAH